MLFLKCKRLWSYAEWLSNFLLKINFAMNFWDRSCGWNPLHFIFIWAALGLHTPPVCASSDISSCLLLPSWHGGSHPGLARTDQCSCTPLHRSPLPFCTFLGAHMTECLGILGSYTKHILYCTVQSVLFFLTLFTLKLRFFQCFSICWLHNAVPKCF